MSISLRKALAHGALGAACLALAAATANARDFRSAEVHPPDYPTTQAVQFLGKQLSEQTKGRLNVRVYPNGSLGTEKDAVEQLRIGALDMTRINTAPLNSVVPETLITVITPQSPLGQQLIGKVQGESIAFPNDPAKTPSQITRVW